MRLIGFVGGWFGLEFKAYNQHAQVIGNSNKAFVHTGVISNEISRKLSGDSDAPESFCLSRTVCKKKHRIIKYTGEI